MENKETKSEEMLIVRNVTEKTSKNGRSYYSVETDRGNYSCFEFDIIGEIKKAIGKKIDVEVASNERGFKNIRKLISVFDIQGESPSSLKPATPDNFSDARILKDQSIYTSYAKDLFIELHKMKLSEQTSADLTNLMETCIRLVKQAKEGFK